MIIDEKKTVFNRILFRWHKTHFRTMPCRCVRDPCRILVSEVMLQQTQVDRVRIKYVEFLKKFPDMKSLADAPLGEVIKEWSGLGYNRRARYLHDCVKAIMSNEGGKFPREFAKLLLLPGIGLSTASALLSFAFGKDEPMIDTNIRRIPNRAFFSTRLHLVSGTRWVRGVTLY